MKPNFINHHLEGVVWEIASKSNPTRKNKVTMGSNGLWCDCKYFTFYGRCPHCEEVANKLCADEVPEYDLTGF